MTQLALDVDSAQRDRLLALIEQNAHYYHRQFPQWLRENWHVWVQFEREATRMRRAGREHYSAYTIVEYLRHSTALAQQGGDFKLNANVVASLARLYVTAHPQAFGFFEFRRLRSKDAPLGVAA